MPEIKRAEFVDSVDLDEQFIITNIFFFNISDVNFVICFLVLEKLSITQGLTLC